MEIRMRTSNSRNELRVDDRIGQLPDDVLGLVVSHLTLKEAGRTTVLSRRWKNLWTLTCHFEFDGSERMRQTMHVFGSMKLERYEVVFESERRKYIRWVDQVVENHQGSNLDELVVVFDLDIRHSLHLDKWISFAVRKKVKAIKIDLGLDSYGSSGRYSFMRSAPGLSGIEFLTSLCLKNVDIIGETIEHLLFACPLLERLCLVFSEQLLNLRIVGSSLKLKYLVIHFCWSLESIEICAPNLMSLHYYVPAGKKPKLQVEGLCCLVDLYINTRHLSYELFQFSSYFALLKTLTLHYEYTEILAVLRRLPRLTNLKHLTFKIQQFHEVCMSEFVSFISLCPFLHKFTLELLIGANRQERSIKWGYLRPHRYLKVVEMLGFVGRSHEIEIAKFFLKTAIKLEKLIVNTHCRSLATDQNKVGGRCLMQLHQGQERKLNSSEVKCLLELSCLFVLLRVLMCVRVRAASNILIYFKKSSHCFSPSIVSVSYSMSILNIIGRYNLSPFTYICGIIKLLDLMRIGHFYIFAFLLVECNCFDNIFSVGDVRGASNQLMSPGVALVG